jgi:hypothetical protein
MATATAIPQITYCPPAPVPHFGLTWGQKLAKKFQPASAATGLSMADYNFMQTVTHAQSYARRLDTPEWAVNFSMQRELLTVFLEQRAQMRGPQQGTLQERRARAVAKLRVQRERMIEVLGRLCAEFVNLKRAGQDTARQKELAGLIQNYDKQLIMLNADDCGLGMIARMIFLYYRAGLDSIGVAGELGIRSEQVRMTLFKLAKTWATITGTVAQAQAAKEQRQAARHHGVKFPHRRKPRTPKPPKPPLPKGRPPLPLSAVDIAVGVQRAEGKPLQKVAAELDCSVQKVVVSLKRIARNAQ